jgi:hypothetical protein
MNTNQNTITLHTENGDWIAVYNGPGAEDIKAAHGKTVIKTAYKAKTEKHVVIDRFKAIYPAWDVGISPTQYTGIQPTAAWVQAQTLLTVARMASEITQDMARQVVPANVNTFIELHEYVDANEYGGFCDDATADKFIAAFGGRNADNYGMPDGYVEFINACQDAIGQWLAERAANAGASNV